MTEGMTDLNQDNVSNNAVSMPESQVPAEKMIPQSQVNRIAQTIKYEDNKKIQDLQNEINSLKSSMSSYNDTYSANNSSVTKADLSAAVRETFSELMQQATEAEQKEKAFKTVENVKSKMLEARTRYSDFDEVAQDVNYQAIPNLVEEIANNNINMDTFYEILKNNPLELMKFEYNLRDQPAKARKELEKISNSIKVNENAKNVQRPNEPISQLTPSNIGLSNDGSDFTVKDFKKLKPWRQ